MHVIWGKGDNWKWGCSFRFQKGYFYYSRFPFLRHFHTIILYKLALRQSVEFSIECAKLFMFISMKDFMCGDFSSGAFKSPRDQLFFI